MIRRHRVVVILLWLGSAALAQSHIPIKGIENTRLAPMVEEAVAMGGVKDRMECDAAHNIYMPVNRGYSSAYGSVVEVMADGKQFRGFSLDGVPRLDTGHIEDFEVADGGSLYVLAREVTKYSDSQVPVAFGSAYILRFDPAGKFESQTKLNIDFREQKPTALAVLKGGDFLVAGYSYFHNKTESMFVDLFSPDGSLKKKAPISSERTQASNTGSVSSMSIVRPMTVKSDGSIFVLRGSTRDPVYVFSDTGELVRTIRLQAENIEFSSPKISNHMLVVHQQGLVPAPTSGFVVLTKPKLDVFPVFNVDSGALVQQFEWRQDGALACYDQNELTIVQQGMDYPANGYWAIIKAQASAAAEPHSSLPNDAGIALQFRWIVPCTGKAVSVPLRGDEAARRFCLSETTVVDDGDIDSASLGTDAIDRIGLRFAFTSEGAQKLRKATTTQQKGELGVVINGELVLKAIVMEPLEHEVVIHGDGLNRKELDDWVTRLNTKIRRRVQMKAI